MKSAAFFASLSVLLPLIAANPEPAPGMSIDSQGIIHLDGKFDIIPDGDFKIVPIAAPASNVVSNSTTSTTTSSAPSSTSASPAALATPVIKTGPSSSSSSSSSSNSSSSHGSSGSGVTFKPKAGAKKKVIPKVQNPSKNTLTSGAQKAVGQFADSGAIPKNLSSALSNALGDAIKAQTSAGQNATTVITSEVPTITKLANSTKAVVVNGTTISPSPIYVTVTENVTRTVTTEYSSSSAVAAAAINVQQAINSAFAAVNLSQSGLNEQTIDALEKCLSTVLSAGGLPAGYACLTASGSNSAGLQATLNTILEQFVGILPNVVLENVFNAVFPTLTNLLPSSESDLINQIKSSISSVIASLSGNSVTAMEQVQQCYTEAIQQKGNTSTLACYSKNAGSTLATATNSVLEQFIGVLPGSLVTQVQNILNYNIANSTEASSSLASKVEAQISSAINSAGNTISGNTVSLAESLQACTTILLTTGNATAAQECITKKAAPVLSSTTVAGIAEQFQGYLPSSFFSDLVQASEPLISNYTANPTKASQAKINGALDSFFNNATSYGPAFTTCILQVQACVTKAIEDSGKIGAVCPGPVKGCDSKKSTRLAKRAYGDNGVAGFLRRKKARSA